MKFRWKHMKFMWKELHINFRYSWFSRASVFKLKTLPNMDWTAEYKPAGDLHSWSWVYSGCGWQLHRSAGGSREECLVPPWIQTWWQWPHLVCGPPDTYRVLPPSQRNPEIETHKTSNSDAHPELVFNAHPVEVYNHN